MRSHNGTIRLTLCFAALLAALTMVIWRQSRALETLRQLDRVRDGRAVAEAERAELIRTIEQLESRASVVAAAESRLHMRVPFAHEIVIVPLQPSAPAVPVGAATNIAMTGAAR